MTSPRTRRPSSTWSYDAAQAAALEATFESILAPLGEAAALISPERGALLVKPRFPSDLATLTEAAYTCHRYLKLGHGDIAILNDPSAGGLSLGDLTLVAGACRRAGEGTADLLIVSRVKVDRRWSSSGKLDDEGVRIPPTPLVSAGHINTELYQAIARHPAAHRDLESKGLATIARLLDAVAGVRALASDAFGDFATTDFRSYQEQAARSFEHAMSKLPLGTSIVANTLPTGETIKLQLEIKESHVEFDFKGTDDSALIGLTERVTMGAAIWATLAWLDYRGPIASGVLDHFHVTTPVKSLVSARYPRGAFRGSFFGAGYIAALVDSALTKQSNKALKSGGAKANAWASFALKGKANLFTLSLTPGQGASSSENGRDAWADWSEAETFSIETLERSAPLMFTFHGLTPNNAGRGQWSGGQGTMTSLRLNADAAPLSVSWILGHQASKQEGKNGGKSGRAARIEVAKPDGKKSEFTAGEGQTDVPPGSEITLTAAGGGGYGAPVTEEDDE